VWIAEVMSQQTTLKVVVERFERFMDEIPDVHTLATCSDEQLRELWAGLGYYRRARNLRRGAELIAGDRGGRFPRDYAAWLGIPGCGPYTAAMLASVCHEEPVPAVDGNAIRVASRFEALGDVWSTGGQRRIRERLDELVRLAAHPGDFNQAVMELGFAVCRKASPQCVACPIASHCLALERGVVDRIPQPRPRRAAVDTELTVLMLTNASEGTVALARRNGGFLSKTVGFPLLLPRDDPASSAIERLAGMPGARLSRVRETFNHSITHHRIRGSVLAVELPADAVDRIDDDLWQAMGVASPSWLAVDDVATRLSSSLDSKAWHTLREEGER
jgi:A/G-specific adenine glycosylase